MANQIAKTTSPFVSIFLSSIVDDDTVDNLAVIFQLVYFVDDHFQDIQYAQDKGEDPKEERGQLEGYESIHFLSLPAF